MKLRNIIMGGVIATTMSACTKHFKEAKNVKPIVTQTLDSLVNESARILERGGYQYFGCDTLNMGKNFEQNVGRFVKEINDSAAANVPTRLEDCKFVLVGTPFGRMPKCVEIRKPIYNETVALIPSSQVYTKGGKKYVAVEYWGK